MPIVPAMFVQQIAASTAVLRPPNVVVLNARVNFLEYPGQNRPGKFPKEMLALYT